MLEQWNSTVFPSNSACPPRLRGFRLLIWLCKFGPFGCTSSYVWVASPTTNESDERTKRATPKADSPGHFCKARVTVSISEVIRQKSLQVINFCVPRTIFSLQQCQPKQASRTCSNRREHDTLPLTCIYQRHAVDHPPPFFPGLSAHSRPYTPSGEKQMRCNGSSLAWQPVPLHRPQIGELIHELQRMLPLLYDCLHFCCMLLTHGSIRLACKVRESGKQCESSFVRLYIRTS